MVPSDWASELTYPKSLKRTITITKLFLQPNPIVAQKRSKQIKHQTIQIFIDIVVLASGYPNQWRV